MSVKRCANAHFYDDGKYSECPHCNKSLENKSPFDDQVTVAKVADFQMRANIADRIAFDGDSERTIGVYKQKMGKDPVVGWLVAKDGPESGRDYRLHSGRNFIGRSSSMDVSIADDRQVSRDNHCSIVYDHLGVTFTIVPGEGTATYLDGEMLSCPMLITEGADIEIGETKLIFVPFCKTGRTW